MDALIDSLTGDYTGTRTTTLSNAVYIRLETPQGSYWADPALGSKLHLLARAKDLTSVHRRAVQYTEQALAPLVDDGRAQSVTVTPSNPQDGWLLLTISVVQANGDPETFTHPVKVI
jgi:phage gp46-like protein